MKTRTAGWRMRIRALGSRVRFLLGVLPLVAAGCAGLQTHRAADVVEYSSTEAAAKAAYLLTFVKFVEWPASAFSERGSPIVLGVLGKDPFGGELANMIEGNVVGGRLLQIRRLKTGDDLRACHILFVSPSEKKSMRRILNRLKDASVLTVGEMEQFTEFGGAINFIKLEDTVCFEINPQAAERAGIRLSSKLLEVAKVVRQEPDAAGR